MHGRLKVKTTLEQQEAKRKEREKKLKLYTGANLKIAEKRKNQEYDKEALTLTGEILSVNPDYYSLWNFRRVIFQHFKASQSEDDLQNLLQEELQFLEGCLRINPKSYGTWHHRGWVMEFIPKPDWSHELLLCNKYLEYDERNFHCWDYRRFVVKHSSVTAEEELEFTAKKIGSNFSNYSSWYYRSKLLPVVHPDENSAVGVKEDVLLSEFELVQNAFFTDPNDQSAWFYHRWLLGRNLKKLFISCAHVCRSTKTVLVCLSKPAKVSDLNLLKVCINGEAVDVKWEPSQFEKMYSKIWVCKVDIAESSQQEIEVSLGEVSKSEESTAICSLKCVLPSAQTEAWQTETTADKSVFRSEMSTAKTAILEQELESCQQLDELEPDNKWTLLTIVSLMKALDPLGYEKQMEEYIDKLIEVDGCRKNYYKDLRSKFLIENILERSGGFPREADLSGAGVTCLYHEDHLCLCTKLNLSENALTKLPDALYLPHLVSLNLDKNHIQSLGFSASLTKLQELSLSNNNISCLEDLEPLEHCKSLEVLNLENNPVCSLDNFTSTVITIIPNLKMLNNKPVSR